MHVVHHWGVVVVGIGFGGDGVVGFGGDGVVGGVMVVVMGEKRGGEGREREEGVILLRVVGGIVVVVFQTSSQN